MRKGSNFSSELISVGTELLLGQISNSNAVFLSQELSKLGIDCFFQSTVGDNKERIKQVLCQALDRAQIIVFTGGLGPTSDDLTQQSIAEFLDKKLVFDPEVYSKIEEFFRKRNRTALESNKKQAFLPEKKEDYQLIENTTGTAPGLIWKLPKSIIVTLPGVPSEMKTMWQESVFPFLEQLILDKRRLFWKEIKFYGVGESKLNQNLAELLQAEDPTLAPLAEKSGSKLRLATKSLKLEEAQAKFDPIELRLKEEFGKYIYSFNSETLEEVVCKLLLEKQLKLALAESCTGGLISHRITQLPGSSKLLEASFVTYTKKAKETLLKIKPSFLEEFGLVSSEVALLMAKQAEKIAKTDLALAITGVLGPEKHDQQEVGKVHLALYSRKKRIQIKKELNLREVSREQNKLIASQEALFLLFQVLKEL